MINNDLFCCPNTSSLSMSIDLALKTIAKSSNKLIFILRDKTDINDLKAIVSYASDKHVQRINLGLQLSNYLIEHDIDDVSYYLSHLLKASEPLIVDNAEILFDRDLNIKPFQLLKNLARHQCLIVVIDARITSDGKLVYGSSSSKDFNQYEKLTDTYILDLMGGKA